MKNNSFALILAISLIISSLIFGNYFYKAGKKEKKIKVTGIATLGFKTDTVKWSVTFEEYVTGDDVNTLYGFLQKDFETFKRVLRFHGIIDKIIMKPVSIYKKYDRYNNFVGYNGTQQVIVITKKIDDVESLAFSNNELIKKGVVIKYTSLSYFYSEIDRLKKELLHKATQNAFERANEILKNTSYMPGDILEARSGIFQIREPYSTDVSDMGVYDTSTREQEISVTVHIVFKLKNRK